MARLGLQVFKDIPYKSLCTDDYHTLRQRQETGLIIGQSSTNQDTIDTTRPVGNEDLEKTPATPEKPGEKTDVIETHAPSPKAVGEVTNSSPLDESKSLLKDFQAYVKSFGLGSLVTVTLFVGLRAGIEKTSRKYYLDDPK